MYFRAWACLSMSYFTQEMSVKDALDDAASNIWRALPGGYQVPIPAEQVQPLQPLDKKKVKKSGGGGGTGGGGGGRGLHSSMLNMSRFWQNTP